MDIQGFTAQRSVFFFIKPKAANSATANQAPGFLLQAIQWTGSFVFLLQGILEEGKVFNIFWEFELLQNGEPTFSIHGAVHIKLAVQEASENGWVVWSHQIGQWVKIV